MMIVVAVTVIRINDTGLKLAALWSRPRPERRDLFGLPKVALFRSSGMWCFEDAVFDNNTVDLCLLCL